MYANFDWKFWRADGMREQDMTDEDIDPHYKQMLKVSFTVWCIYLTNMNTVSRCSQQLVLYCFPLVLHCCSCGYIHDRLDFALVGGIDWKYNLCS